MSFLPSIEERPVLLDVLKAYPATAKPLLEYHEALLRGDSPLSMAERELIAAYVSSLNGCRYCRGVHGAIAEEMGVDNHALTALLDRNDDSAVPVKLRALLLYAAKLTLSPAAMTSADASAVFAAGWNERALHDTVSICSLFNFMNRLVEGLGIKADANYFRMAAKRLTRGGYAGLIKLLSPGGRSPASRD